MSGIKIELISADSDGESNTSSNSSISTVASEIVLDLPVKKFYIKFIEYGYFAETGLPCGRNCVVLKCLLCEKNLSVGLKTNGNIYRHLKVS